MPPASASALSFAIAERRHGPSGTMAALIAWAVVMAAATAALLAGGELLRDTDDQMRAVQVLRWIDGGGWYGLVEPRLNPPHGVDMHWSRLPDLPIAAVLLLFEPAIGRDAALAVAAAAVPAGLLLGLLLAVVWAARPLLGDDAPVACLALAMALPVIGMFLPGRIDHHNWQLLFAALLCGGVLRMIVAPAGRTVPLVAGLAGALGLWVGGEMLPWAAAANLALALRFVLRDGAVARPASAMAGAMALATLALLPLARPPAGLLSPACDAFSVVPLALAALSWVFWAVMRHAGRHARSAATRGALVAAAGAGALAAGAVLFPGCLGGPLGRVDPELARVWLRNVQEASPAWVLLLAAPQRLPVLLAAPVIGLVLAVALAVRSRGEARAAWIAQLIFLTAALALTLWQIRVATFAGLFAVAPIAAALALAWRRADRMAVGPRRIALRTGALVALSPLPWLLVAAATTETRAAAVGGCDTRPAAAALAGAPPAVVAAFIDLGPRLLLQTPHAVLAAPYHRNSAGILDTWRIFSARDEAEARAVVDRRGADYLLACTAMPEQRLYAAGPGESLAGRLAAGRVPDWLEAVPLADAPELRLYRVRRGG